MTEALFKFQWQEAVCDRHPGFAGLADEARAALTLTPTERLVALALSTWMNGDGAGARPGISRLCAATGRRRRDTVTTALAELERKGYLERVHKGGRGGAGASVYLGRLPGELVTPGDQEARHDTYPASHLTRPGLVTSANEASHLSRTPSVQDHSRDSRARARGECDECNVNLAATGGRHSSDCSRPGQAAA